MTVRVQEAAMIGPGLAFPLPTLPRKRERASVPRNAKLPLPLAGEGWGGGNREEAAGESTPPCFT